MTEHAPKPEMVGPSCDSRSVRRAESGRKIDALESIRGIAAMVVVLSHGVLTFWPEWKSGMESAPPFMHLWHRGDFAVRVFFVLSGFVLSYSFWATRDIAVVQSAAIRRYFRLLVPVLSSVLFAWSLQQLGWFRHHDLADTLPIPNNWLHSFYASPRTFVEAIDEGLYRAFFDFQYTTTLNAVLWTMEVELKGSFIIYTFLALAGHWKRRTLIYIALIAIFDRLGQRMETDFLVGMAVCDWHLSRPPQIDRFILCTAIALCALGLGDLQPEWLQAATGIASLTRGSRFWPTIAAAALIVSVVRSQRLESFLQTRLLVTLGAASFAIYLLHVPLLCSLSAWSYLALQSAGWTHTACAVMATGVYLASSIAAGGLGPLAFDVGGIKLGKWVEHQFRSNSPLI